MSDLTLAQSHAEAALSLSLFRHNNLGNPSEFGGTDEGSPSATPSRELDLGRVGDVETGPKRTRNPRACDQCRKRRIKCTEGVPCKHCREHNYPHCSVRDKARPSRHAHKGGSAITVPIIAGSSFRQTMHHSQFLPLIERTLQDMYRTKTGFDINLTLSEEDTLPRLHDPRILPPEPPITYPEADNILTFFDSGMLAFFGFLNPLKERDLLRTYLTQEGKGRMPDDEKALLFACLALGRLRQLMLNVDVDETVPMGRKESYRIITDEDRWDAIWYRHALVILGRWGSASMTALQAYTCMQLYCLCTTTLSAARHITDMMAEQARQLCILKVGDTNRLSPDLAHQAREMLFHVLFGSCFIAHLDGLAPSLKSGDFDASILNQDGLTDDIRYSKFANSSLFSQLLLECELLTHIHDKAVDTQTVEFVLGFESKWVAWLSDQAGRKATDAVAERFVNVHYHWDRIMLRVPSMDNPLLSLSSYSIIARSTLHILYTYRSMYATTKNFNLALPQFKRTVHCGQLILLCYYKGELVLAEALEGLRMASYLLEQFAYRWRTAAEALHNMIKVAEAFGIPISEIHDHPGHHIHHSPAAPASAASYIPNLAYVPNNIPTPLTLPHHHPGTSSMHQQHDHEHEQYSNEMQILANTDPALMVGGEGFDGGAYDLGWNFDLGAYLSRF